MIDQKSTSAEDFDRNGGGSINKEGGGEARRKEIMFIEGEAAAAIRPPPREGGCCQAYAGGDGVGFRGHMGPMGPPVPHGERDEAWGRGRVPQAGSTGTRSAALRREQAYGAPHDAIGASSTPWNTGFGSYVIRAGTSYP